MSDGNYNRNLLPYHDYQSGVRAGRATMRKLAAETFVQLLKERLPALSDDERQALAEDFKARLK